MGSNLGRLGRARAREPRPRSGAHRCRAPRPGTRPTRSIGVGRSGRHARGPRCGSGRRPRPAVGRAPSMTAHRRRSGSTTAAALTASTGRLIITSTRALRPRVAAGRRARRSEQGARSARSRAVQLVAAPAASRSVLGLVGAGLVDHDAVAQEDHPVGPRRVPGLVGDQHAGRARVAARRAAARSTSSPVSESSAPVGSSASIEPAVADQRPRDRHPLLLPAGQLVGEAVGEVGEPDLGQRGERRGAGLARPVRRRARAAARRSRRRSAPG